MKQILIKNACIVSMDKKIGIIPRGDILIEGTRIKSVGMDIDAPDAEIIQAENMIAAPGFVDGHRHNWQTLLKMIGVNFTMGDYVSGIKWTFGDVFDTDEIYLSEYLGALECLNAGTTTMCNFAHNNITPEHTDAQIKAMMDSGIRCVFAYAGSNFMWKEMPSTVPYDYEDCRRAHRKYCQSEDQLLTMAIGGRGPQNVPMELALEELNLAKELDVMCMLSIGEGLWASSCPNTVELLHKLNMVTDKLQFTHLNAISREEFQIIADTGASVVMCPEVELSMGFGWNSTLKCLDKQILPGISSDTPPSVSCDMISQMKTTLITARNQVHLENIRKRQLNSPMVINAEDVLRYATVGGAGAVGMKHKIGTLEEGKEADIILVSTENVQMWPVNGAVNALVEYASPESVDTVIVGGKIVKKDKKLVGIDMKGLRTKVERTRNELFEKCGVPADGFWKPEFYEPDFEV